MPRACCYLLERGSNQSLNSSDGLQKALLNQSLEMIPDVIGIDRAAEMEAQFEVRELGGIGQVCAGDEQFLIGHHSFIVTNSLLSIKRKRAGIKE